MRVTCSHAHSSEAPVPCCCRAAATARATSSVRSQPDTAFLVTVACCVMCRCGECAHGAIDLCSQGDGRCAVALRNTAFSVQACYNVLIQHVFFPQSVQRIPNPAAFSDAMFSAQVGHRVVPSALQRWRRQVPLRHVCTAQPLLVSAVSHVVGACTNQSAADFWSHHLVMTQCDIDLLVSSCAVGSVSPSATRGALR